MISFVRGKASDMTETSVILENNGIGFEIFMTGNDLSRIHIGEEYKIHTYFQVREDAMVLFGFLQKDDLAMFRLLLGVNGIGPKGALGVLSGLSADELRFAILADDAKTVSKAPGIGKKTAQRIILELKDQLAKEQKEIGGSLPLPENAAGWEDIRNGNRYEGGQSVVVAVDLEAIPVFRRLK